MKGKEYSSKKEMITDPKTGKRVWRLTGGSGINHHLYFTNTSFINNNKGIVFASDRGGKAFNYYAMDLNSGCFKQLSDCRNVDKFNSWFAAVDPLRNILYYFDGPVLMRLNMTSLEERQLYRVPDEKTGFIISVSADGERIAFAEISTIETLWRRNFKRIAPEWSAEQLKALRSPRRESIITVIESNSGAARHFTVSRRVTHVNFCPVNPDLILYCSSSPRMWLLDISSGESYSLRPEKENERLCHEFWLADGKTVCFHGCRTDNSESEFFYGSISVDGGKRREFITLQDTSHCHADASGKIIFCDGNGIISRIRPIDDRHAELIPLFHHDSHWDAQLPQISHPHPNVSPDGKFVIFSSNKNGIIDVYFADIINSDLL